MHEQQEEKCEEQSEQKKMGNVQGVGFAGPWIPESAFAGTGTITRPRLSMAYKNESYK